MMIYNIPPFKGETTAQIMKSIRQEDIVFRNPAHYKYSSLAIDFLRKILIREPRSRPSAS